MSNKASNRATQVSSNCAEEEGFADMNKILATGIFCPLILAGVWSCYPGLEAMMASYKFDSARHKIDWWNREEAKINLKRKIQGHFRNYSVHIPTEDIVFRPEKSEAEHQSFLQLDRTCGHGNVYVWVPLIFRFPMTGNKVIEWCWIPQVSIEKK